MRKRSMWGRESFRFVGKEEMLNEINFGASSGPNKGEKLPP